MGSRPIIAIDWSDFSLDRQQQLLRASLAIGGRTITLLEALYPYHQLAGRQEQHEFLLQLKQLLPQDCQPIIIADAGFRAPFYRFVESLNWHWVGRIRNRDFVQWQGAPNEWVPCKSLYAVAKRVPLSLGVANWVRTMPLSVRLVVYRKVLKGRKDRTLYQSDPRRSTMSRQHAQRERQPWLLVCSLSLHDYTARQIVNLYTTRMQIELGFRDMKSRLQIARGANTSQPRVENLLLIAALAHTLLWWIGEQAKRHGMIHWVRVNSSSKQADYSNVLLAQLVLKHASHRFRKRSLESPDEWQHQYWNTIMGLG